jgi:hypothetical protein
MLTMKMEKLQFVLSGNRCVVHLFALSIVYGRYGHGVEKGMNQNEWDAMNDGPYSV